MGQNKSKNYCGFQEVRTLNDQAHTTCQGEGWIVRDSPPGDDHEVMKTAAYRQLQKVGKSKRLTWHMTRWAALDPASSQEDVKARVKFLQEIWLNKHFYQFLPNADAWDLADKHRDRVIAYLDDTVPGRVNLIYITRQNQPYSTYHPLSRRWLTHRTGLSDMIKLEFGRPVKLSRRR